jgi:hypothetical protein
VKQKQSGFKIILGKRETIDGFGKGSRLDDEREGGTETETETE